jgi:prepilin-type N-terminal cleavage/methylation domain-containing protein
LIIRIKNRDCGFSLVELLLTLVLILCLAAAAVFSFTAIYRSANLDEGLDRMQALIRFAQAEAATTGCKVRIQFEPTPAETAEEPTDLRRIRVTWEPDYLTAPGLFQTYTNKSWSEEMVNELVGVEMVKPLDKSSGVSTAVENVEQETEDYFGGEFPAITFYPDGSCDSAEIVLASLNEDDQRRLAVRITGILGSISSRSVSSDETTDPLSDEFSEEIAAEEFEELFESGTPVESSNSW